MGALLLGCFADWSTTPEGWAVCPKLKPYRPSTPSKGQVEVPIHPYWLPISAALGRSLTRTKCCFCHVGEGALTLICRVSSTAFRQLACHFSDVSFDNNRFPFLFFVNRIFKTWRGSCRSMILLSASFRASFSALLLISPCSRCMSSGMPQGLPLVVSCPFTSVSHSPDD